MVQSNTANEPLPPPVAQDQEEIISTSQVPPSFSLSYPHSHFPSLPALRGQILSLKKIQLDIWDNIAKK